MNKRVIFIAAVVLLLAATAAMLFYNRETPVDREKYPYVGQSLLSSVDYSGTADRVIVDDVDLQDTLGLKDYIVIGRFVTGYADAEKVPVQAIPEEGTRLYEKYKALADKAGKSLEEFMPVHYNKIMQFEVIDSFGGEFVKGDIIPVRTSISQYIVTDKPLFPDVKKGDMAVLIIWKPTYTDKLMTNTVGFFYIDEYDRVISAEKYPSLEQYTGMKLSEFKKILRGTYDEVQETKP